MKPHSLQLDRITGTRPSEPLAMNNLDDSVKRLSLNAETAAPLRGTPRHNPFAGLLALILLTLLPWATTQGALLWYEDFNYSVGEELGDPAGSLAWENDKTQFTIGAGSLEHVGLQTSSGNRVLVEATTVSYDSVRTVPGTWTAQSSGALYISFLLRLESTINIDTTGDGTSILTIGRDSNSSQMLGVSLRDVGGTIQLGVLKYPGGPDSPTSAFFNSGAGADLGSSTVLVVAKYEYVAGTANDIVTVWVNPNNTGASEDPANKVFTSAGTDGTQVLERLTLCRGLNLSIDEIRIGQTWPEVTPTGGLVVQQQPVITEAFLSDSELVLRGTNGTPDGVYQVLRSPDLMTAPALWSSIATNTFDGAGQFDSTNMPPPPGSPQAFYRLLMGGELPSPPVITTHPMNATVVEGQNASFGVVAAGTQPLSYQWYFNSSTIPEATNSGYTVTGAQPADAGDYFVTVSNLVGSVTSAPASLTIVPSPTAGTPDAYATVGSGTTGGAGGPTVTVDNFADFEFYVDNNTGPHIVLVSGTINLGGSNVRIRDNKTIIGLGTDATLVGDLKAFGNNNIILQNLNFTNPGGAGDNDGLTLQDCLNVWVDHCTFYDGADGNLDITHGADWVTVSWCHFFYTDPGASHRFSNLVGHSDNNAGEDDGKLHITFHHNWWGQHVHERMPRVRFGRVHLYNNYFNAPGNNYCIRAALGSEILVENNYFDSVKNVWELYRTTGEDGKLYATNNIEMNTTWSSGDTSSIQIPGTDILSIDPNGLNRLPYSYTLDPAAAVPNSVTNNAGAGRGPFAP